MAAAIHDFPNFVKWPRRARILCNVMRFSAAESLAGYAFCMSISCAKTLEFRDDIEQLIAEIDDCLPQVAANDREHELQRAAYHERRSQAQRLFETLRSREESQWSRLDGDAHRIHEALKLSLAFFRRLL